MIIEDVQPRLRPRLRLVLFDKYSADGNRKFWRCAGRLSDNCPAQIHTEEGEIVHSLHDCKACQILDCGGSNQNNS